MDDNPYQPPRVNLPLTDSPLTFVRVVRYFIANLCLVLGCMLFVAAQVTTFVPGAEVRCYALTAGLGAVGFLSVEPQARWLALGLVLLSACLIGVGYVRGLEYERLEQQFEDTVSRLNSAS